MERARYASSATTVEPSANVTVLPYRPFHVGPSLRRPSGVWQFAQPRSLATCCPLEASALSAGGPSPPPDTPRSRGGSSAASAGTARIRVRGEAMVGQPSGAPVAARHGRYTG